jgi:hypothetical protein
MDEREARTDEKGGAWGRARLVGGRVRLVGRARTLGGGRTRLVGRARTPSREGTHAWGRARLGRGAHTWWGGAYAWKGARTPSGEGAHVWRGAHA